MRRVVVLGVCAAVGLTIAGVAVAWLTANGTSTVSATFSTTTAKGFKSRSCTGPDGQYQLIDAVYDGSSASAEGKLNGDARIRIRSVYNTTEKIGWANGWLRLDGAVTHFDAVNVDGKLTGLLRGRIGGYGNLLATFTGDFSASGLANAQIGTGTFPSVALVTGRSAPVLPARASGSSSTGRSTRSSRGARSASHPKTARRSRRVPSVPAHRASPD